METFAEGAIAIIDELHTERLDYTSEYVPLINAAQTLAAYENTGLTPEDVQDLREKLAECEPKHGHWELNAGYFECSNCNQPALNSDTAVRLQVLSDYCPHCGAIMDEAVE